MNTSTRLAAKDALGLHQIQVQTNNQYENNKLYLKVMQTLKDAPKTNTPCIIIERKPSRL